MRDFNNTQPLLVRAPRPDREAKNRQLCRRTFYDKDKFQKHFYFSTIDCDLKSSAFGEAAIAVAAKPHGSNFLNDLVARLGTGGIKAPTARKFAQGQIGLQTNGYGAWEQAFPNYVKANEKYSKIIFEDQPSLGGKAKKITLGAGWLPQKMWRSKSNWAQYLLRLATLFEVGIRVVDESGNIVATGAIESVSTTAKISYHATQQGIVVTDQKEEKIINTIDPTDLTHRTFRTFINVIVRYAGLQIFVGDIGLEHKFMPSDEELQVETKFLGAESVSVTGNYRGLGSTGIAATVKDLVESEIQSNLKMLTSGNDGKGWVTDLRLKAGIIELTTSLESGLNAARFMRPDHEVSLDYISPKRGVNREFDEWTNDVITALFADYGLFTAANCHL